LTLSKITTIFPINSRGYLHFPYPSLLKVTKCYWNSLRTFGHISPSLSATREENYGLQPYNWEIRRTLPWWIHQRIPIFICFLHICYCTIISIGYGVYSHFLDISVSFCMYHILYFIYFMIYYGLNECGSSFKVGFTCFTSIFFYDLEQPLYF